MLNNQNTVVQVVNQVISGISFSEGFTSFASGNYTVKAMQGAWNDQASVQIADQIEYWDMFPDEEYACNGENYG